MQLMLMRSLKRSLVLFSGISCVFTSLLKSTSFSSHMSKDCILLLLFLSLPVLLVLPLLNFHSCL
uniref:Ovule protein n=1 Tax=Parascaris univalens TaxID=6257 RepID=A0A915ATF4_PARUN